MTVEHVYSGSNGLYHSSNRFLGNYFLWARTRVIKWSMNQLKTFCKHVLTIDPISKEIDLFFKRDFLFRHRVSFSNRIFFIQFNWVSTQFIFHLLEFNFSVVKSNPFLAFDHFFHYFETMPNIANYMLQISSQFHYEKRFLSCKKGDFFPCWFILAIILQCCNAFVLTLERTNIVIEIWGKWFKKKERLR